jgi:hypothetical protein
MPPRMGRPRLPVVVFFLLPLTWVRSYEVRVGG